MSAICGVWNRDGKDAQQDCARMRRALAIYGPDREGAWHGGAIALGVQRFHCLPEDRFDHQPLSGGGGRFRLVADVRLDNRSELAQTLDLFGASTLSDADIVLAAWERWQDASLDRLIGDWAIAVWDESERTLTLARDMIGTRPLFYHAGRHVFAFASMAKGLHALADIPIGPDFDTLRDYIALAPRRGPGSFFQGIARVEQGGKVVLKADGRVEPGQWYDWNRIETRTMTDDAACIEAFRDLFDRAVAARLRSTGPIGSELSSGFDSTAVTITAARILAAQGKQLTACTHVPHQGWQTEVPQGRCGDEGPIAAATAAQYPNIDHVRVDSADRLIGESLDADFYYGECPVLNLCNIVWANAIARTAHMRGIGVMLNGTYGNMSISLAGYERLHELIRHGRFADWLHEARCLRRNKVLRYRGALYRSLGPWLPQWLHTDLSRLFGRRGWTITDRTAMNQALANSDALRQRLKALDFDPAYRPHVSVRRMAEFVLRRTDHIAQLDKGTLARFHVDRRDPTADRRLIEFSLSLPARFWLRDGVAKWLYRQAFRGQVPAAVMNLPSHGYQGADWPERLRRSKDALSAETLATLDDPALQTLLDNGFLRHLAKSPLPDTLATTEGKITYRLKWFRALSVAHFVRKANPGNGPA